jgi:hypothetical protein
MVIGWPPVFDDKLLDNNPLDDNSLWTTSRLDDNINNIGGSATRGCVFFSSEISILGTAVPKSEIL